MVTTHKHHRLARRLTSASSVALVVASVFSVSPAQAQTTASDTRWQAYAGCWAPVSQASVGVFNSTGTMVCVVPSTNGRTVEIASIANNKIVHVDRVAPTGERLAKTVDGCAGWESSMWSKDGRRLFIRSEFKCGDSVKVVGSTVFSISTEGNWAHVQGNTIGKNADSRVTLFKHSDVALAPDMVLADSAVVRTVPVELSFSERMVRLAAAEPASVDAILELARNTDKQVAQTWVAEFGKPTELKARDIVALADAGMPPEVIDIMVAKANPTRFALQANAAIEDGPRPTSTDIARVNGVNNNCNGFNNGLGYRGMYGSLYNQSMYNSGFNCPLGYGIGGFPYGMNMYGFGNGGFGFGGYGYGNYFRGTQPIIIVTRGPDGEIPQGRAVRGQGYTRGGSNGSSSNSAPRTSSGSSSSGSSSSGSSSAGSTGGVGGASSGGASTGRTAVPKTPPPSL